MPRGHSDRFERYVAALSDAETLQLHRVVCRRASAIYGPMFRARQEANYRAAMSVREAALSTRETVG